MKELENWKQTGWLVTRKLVYYALAILAFVFLISTAGSLMTLADTFAFVVGVLLGVVAIGGLFTLTIREIFFYFKYFSNR